MDDAGHGRCFPSTSCAATQSLAIDLNVAHLAAVASTLPATQFVHPSLSHWICPGCPRLLGRPTTVRDFPVGRPGQAAGCQSLVIEYLDFTDARKPGKENTTAVVRPEDAGAVPIGASSPASPRPAFATDSSRWPPTGTWLSSPSTRPTPRWGADIGSAPCDDSSDATGHHAAAVVIGRRGFGQRARRRERCDSTRPRIGKRELPIPLCGPRRTVSGLAERHPRKPGNCQARAAPTGQKTQRADRRHRATRRPRPFGAPVTSARR